MFLNWLIGETGLDMNCTNLKTLGGGDSKYSYRIDIIPSLAYQK
jgi:hypothetical protein